MKPRLAGRRVGRFRAIDTSFGGSFGIAEKSPLPDPPQPTVTDPE